MSRKNQLWLLAAVLAALMLCFVLGGRIASRLSQVQEITSALEASQQSWQHTAAEKEAMQAELKTVQSDLREAELTLSESLTRETELEAEIQALEEEIALLKSAP